MTASLVSLFQPRQGWTNDERAQFARIERLLEDAGFGVDVEHGLSDEGEPWCVFCSRITGDVVIHVACIDGRFMFDSSTLPRPIEGASFTRCAERFFEDVSLPMPLAQRRDRVLLHPSALLASLFITVLLYAQATTEQPLFDAEPVDVDDPDSAAQQLSPMALRIRAIAQQVADYVNGSENGPQAAQSAAQAYVNPMLASIPAGMAFAVIAIAQDLASAEAALTPLLDGESRLAPDDEDEALARAEVLAPAEQKAAEDGDTEASERLLTAHVAATTTATETEGDVVPPVTEAFSALLEEIADGLATTVETARRAVDGLDFALWSPGAEDETEIATVGDGTSETGSAQAETGFGVSGLFVIVEGLEAVLQSDTVSIALDDRLWEVEVFRVVESTIARIESVLLGEDALADSFVLADGAVMIDGAEAAPDGTATTTDGDPLAGDDTGAESATGQVDLAEATEEPVVPPSPSTAQDGADADGLADEDAAAGPSLEGPTDPSQVAGLDGGLDGGDDGLPTGPARPVSPVRPSENRDPYQPEAPSPAPSGGQVRAEPLPPEPRDLPVVSVAEFGNLMNSFAEQVGLDPLDLKPISGQSTWLILDDNITDPSRGAVGSEDIVWTSVYVAELGVEAKFAGAAWDFQGFDL